MILRLVRGRVPDDALGSLRTSFEGAYVPGARRTPGLARFHLGLRDRGDGETELLSLTFWTSVEAALEAYGGDLMASRTLGGLDPVPALDEVAHFEIDETILRRPSLDPCQLRLTVGRVGAGIDVEIQQELRRRVPLLGEAMREAYVARRITASDVEVAFVSCWDGTTDTPLDVAFWPEISGRYDAFDLRVYRTLGSGGDPAR